MMKTLLLAALATVSGNTIIGLDTVTEPKLSGGKKNPMKGRVKKIMTGANVMVFTNQKSNGYENMVNRRLIAEGKDASNFTLGPRAWGERVPDMPLVAHKGETYLEVIFLKAGKVSFTLDGAPIERSEIEGLDQKEEGDQGGLSNKVIVRDYKLTSLKEVRIDHVAFRLI